MAALESGRGGLEPDIVANRLAQYGPNKLPAPQIPSILEIYGGQFRSPFIYLLFAATAVSLLIGEFLDAAFIFVVLQINAAIGTAQEWGAVNRAESLKKLIQLWAVVRRGGISQRIDSEDLVPGDIVLMEPGLRVPADLRLIEAKELGADESLLTGESMPVPKSAELIFAADAPAAECRNMLYAGSTVVRGRGAGVVCETGGHTQIGRIATEMLRADTSPPPLVVRMEQFARVVAWVMMVIIVVIAGIELLRGTGLAEVFLVAVALAVAAIPEGLPVALTVALSTAVSRMGKRNVIVRRLPAVEGLGACTLIAADKTGTLTLNEMTVRRLWLPQAGDVDVDGDGLAVPGALSRAGGDLSEEEIGLAQSLALAGGLCNEATLAEQDDGTVIRFGDTVDLAFLVLARKLGITHATLPQTYAQVAAIPYEPSIRYAAAFVREGDQIIAHAKGAAETILPMCQGVDVDAAFREVDRLAARGFRVLALASGSVDPSRVSSGPAHALTNLNFLGLACLIDPLRPDAPSAIRKCGEAGLRVCMITGDHPLTALAIARDLGFADSLGDVVTGSQLTQASAEEFDALAQKARVFARVAPLQKQEIVEALRRAGHFVAVTGDGVNDAPALKSAEIGVAMGQSGTDVARDAAELILADDNFESVVAGVEEGRIAYDNVRKVIYLLISANAAEIAIFALVLVAGLPLPLGAVQLLWLNLVTDGAQTMMMAFEKGEPDVLKRPPRDPKERIFNRQMIEQVLLAGSFGGGVSFLIFWFALESGWSTFEASNAVLLFLVFFENAQVFNCRSESRSVLKVPLSANPLLILGVLFALGIHLFAMFFPPLGTILGVAPMGPERWVPLAVAAAALIGVMEVYKILVRRRERTARDIRAAAAAVGS